MSEHHRLTPGIALLIAFQIFLSSLVSGCGGGMNPAVTANVPVTDISASLVETTDPSSVFNLEVRFPNPENLMESQKQVFASAAARWEEIITGDIPDISVVRRAARETLVDDPCLPRPFDTCVVAPIN